MSDGAPLVVRFGPFVLDVTEHRLTRDGEPIPLPPKVFDLLRILASSGGSLMTKDALMDALWPGTAVEEGNLTKGIFLLRQALGDTGGDRVYIQTVPRVGYRFVAAADRSARTEPDAARVPDTLYARNGDVHIAYQVAGRAGPDLVLVPGWVSHVEYAWEEPTYARFLHRLASFCRLIILDRRGTGLSDRAAELPSIAQQVDDLRAVMDAAGSQRAALFGVSEGGPMCTTFATTYPERTTALVLFGTTARWMRTPDYPAGIPDETLDGYVERLAAGWGTGVSADLFAPNVARDEAFRRSWGRFERFAVSPAGIRALLGMLREIDIRPLLGRVAVPTLVLHRTGDRAVRVANGAYLAERIPGAAYRELPGDDHFPFVGDVESIAACVEEFLAQQARPARTEATRLR